MRTFQEPSTLSEPHGDEPVDRFTLAYMAGLARDRIHQMILQAFDESGLTRAQLARRLGMDKSRVSKILNTSSNITAETLGEVMFAIDGSCPKVERHWPLREKQHNLLEPVWLSSCVDGAFQLRGSTSECEHLPLTTEGPSLFLTVSKRVEAHEHA